MRIVCQKCAAAYAIDDRVITPKGVRAQCPRCRHLQLVKREETPAQPAPPSTPVVPAVPSAPSPSASGSLSDQLFADLEPLPAPAPSPVDSLFGELSAPTPASPELAPPEAAPAYPAPSSDALFELAEPEPPRPALSSDALFDFAEPAPAAPAQSEAPSDALFDFAEPAPAAPAQPAAPSDALFDFADPAPAQPAAPMQPAAPAQPEPASDALFDFFGSSPAESASAPAPMPAGTPTLAPSEPAAPVACRECGKSIADPFEQAMGVCESCSQREKQAAAPKTVEAFDLPPMSAPSPSPEPRSGGRSAAAPAVTAEPRSGVRPSAPRPLAMTGVAVSASGGGGGRGALVAVLVLVLLLGGGGAAYVFVPSVKALVAQHLGVGGASDSSGSSGAQTMPAALEAVLPRWQLMFVDLGGGDSAQLLSEGQALLAKDQRLAYVQAAESFQRALLLDPSSDAAIGGYVQALALGLGARMEDASFEEARALIEVAESRAGRKPELLVSHANLLLVRSGRPEHLEQARKLAEEVLASEEIGPHKAEAHLVLGRIFLGSSRELANQHFEAAQALAPELQRVLHYRALADEAAGDYSRALEALEKRLELDPEHWDSLSTLARILLEVGEVDRARALYQARLKKLPGDFQALLSLAVLRYQVDGSVSGGASALRSLLRNREKYEERDVAEALLHVSTVERLSGDEAGATKAAREAMELVKELPAAHLQLFMVALSRKDAAAAAGHLASLRGKLDDAALEMVLEGRLRMLEQKPVEALERFQEAVRLDSRRVDAMLLSGVAAAQAGRRDEAFRVLAQALQADPTRLEPRPVVTSAYLRPGELLKGTEDSILKLSGGREDVLPVLYEGLLQFHGGNASAAERLFKRVGEVDSNNAPALAYRALLALERRSVSSAKPLAARAVAVGRQVAIAHFVQGLVLAGSRQVEPAKRALREALALSPTLAAAEVKLAELEAASNRDSARARLLKVVGIDPSYLAAKRLLFTLDRRG